MRIRRRSLRKLLVIVGFAVGIVRFPDALAGGLLLLVGSGLHLWSRGCLEQNLRLTTAGPYRWTRNPFYLANLSIDLGLCFVIGRGWVAVLFLPVWWFSYRETISREEARLLELFPETYPDYLGAVPRLVPSGRRLPRERMEGQFSWHNAALARGSEFARLLGVWLAPGMIWVAELIRRERMAIFDEANSTTLGLLAVLLCGWIIKLALAETFRRPETALLPFASRPVLRHGITVLLLAGAVFFGSLWAASLLASLCLLMLLDRVGESRLDQKNRSEPLGWRYFPMIAIGSIATYGLIALLIR